MKHRKSRKHRRSRARRGLKHVLVLNPRRRRHSRRRTHSRRRRHSNPSRGGILSIRRVTSKDTLYMVLGAVGGYAGARFGRDQISKFLPVSTNPTIEGLVNIAIKIGVAAIGGNIIHRYNRNIGVGFAIGALTSAAWDGIALVTGTPLSMKDYVSPRSLSLRAYTNRPRLASGAMTAFRGAARMPGMGAYPVAFNRQFARAF